MPGLTTKAVRNWNELTADEKIERMREQVKYLQGTMESLQSINMKLQEHQHTQDGKVCIGMHAGHGLCFVNKSNQNDSDNVYF